MLDFWCLCCGCWFHVRHVTNLFGDFEVHEKGAPRASRLKMHGGIYMCNSKRETTNMWTRQFDIFIWSFVGAEAQEIEKAVLF
jgi:hypothetical protein